MAALTAPSTAPEGFNCKGGSSTKIMLSLIRNQFEVSELSDTNPILRRVAVLAAKIARLFNQFSSPAEIDIHRSEEFLDSIEAKFREIGTAAAKNNSGILAGQTDPLRQESTALKTRSAGLVSDSNTIRDAFDDRAQKALKNYRDPEAGAPLVTLDNRTTDTDRQFTQLHKEQASLARRFNSAVNTAINLVPDLHKLPFLKKWEERSRPGA